MRKTRLTLVAAVAAALCVPSAASAATSAPAPQNVDGLVSDVLSVAVTTPLPVAPMALAPGSSATAATAVTVTDTTPLTPHNLYIYDDDGVGTAGHMQRSTGTGPAELANAIEWSTDLGATYTAVQGNSADPSADMGTGAGLAVDPYAILFRQSVNSNELLEALSTYRVTVKYVAVS